MTVAWIPYYSFGVFFTPMLSEFGWSRAVTSGGFSASQIVRGLAGIVMGRLNDKVGPRKVLTGCALLLGVGYLLMYFIHSLWQFYVFYTLLMGLGLSGFFVPMLSTVARWFMRKRAAMSGIVMAATGVATLVGAPLASMLLSVYSWRFAFVIMGAAVLLVIPVSAQFLRREPAEAGQSPDGEVKNLEAKRSEPVGMYLSQAIRTSSFWLYFFAGTSIAYCLFTIMVHIVPHAIVINMSPADAANILATFGLFNLVGRLLLGNAADRIGDRRLYVIGFSVTVASFFGLALLPGQAWMLYSVAGVFGIAQGGMGTVGSPLLAEMFGLRSHGLIFGVANVGYTIGAALGPIVTGYIFDVTGGYQMAFIVSFAVAVVGLFLSILLKRTRPPVSVR